MCCQVPDACSAADSRSVHYQAGVAVKSDSGKVVVFCIRLELFRRWF